MREDGNLILSSPYKFKFGENYMKLKKQNLYWGILFIILDIIAVVVEIVKKTAQNAGEIFFVGYIVACSVFGVIGITYLILGIVAFCKGVTDKRTKAADTKAMCTVAMFCAVAYALTFLKLPVSFLSLEIKDAMIVLCTLIFGPMAGLKIAIIVPFIEMITHSSTGVYGLIMNVLSSATFALVAGAIYKYKRSFYGAIFALASGIFSVTLCKVNANGISGLGVKFASLNAECV
jgi:predicted membrane protein